jgi:hypothetical protein
VGSLATVFLDVSLENSLRFFHDLARTFESFPEQFELNVRNTTNDDTEFLKVVAVEFKRGLVSVE